MESTCALKKGLEVGQISDGCYIHLAFVKNSPGRREGGTGVLGPCSLGVGIPVCVWRFVSVTCVKRVYNQTNEQFAVSTTPQSPFVDDDYHRSAFAPLLHGKEDGQRRVSKHPPGEA